MKTKELLEESKKATAYWKQKAADLEKDTETELEISHPLVDKMKKGKFILQRGDEEIVINSINELLDLIGQHKS